MIIHKFRRKNALSLPVVLLALITCLGFGLFAQQDDDVVEVKALLSRDGIHPGETVKTAIILKIRPGYHINDNAPLDEFMFPTSLTFEDMDGLEILEIYYPTGHRGRFAYSEEELVVYEGEAVLGAVIKTGEALPTKPLTLKGSVSYQACDNVSCLPPKEVGFEVPLTIVPSSKKTNDTHVEVFSKLRFRTVKN